MIITRSVIDAVVVAEKVPAVNIVYIPVSVIVLTIDRIKWIGPRIVDEIRM